MMKSSTLMVILLVVQAVLIMGVFAAVPIENSAVAGEEEVTANPCPGKGSAPYCTKCTKDPVNGKKKCEDEVAKNFASCRDKTMCRTCTEVKGFPDYYKCNDDFNGTCCNLKN